MQRKVAILGAAGGIGQPLSLLMKLNPRVGHLSLYDVVNAPGVAADLGHIDTNSKVTGHLKDDLEACLTGSDLVIIPAGVPRKPGMTRDDLFNTNAGIVKTLAEASSKYCPSAHVLIISNPVNSTVPIFAEVLKKHGKFDPRRLYGVTTLDLVRASRFLAQVKDLDPSNVMVPVIGGHSGVTIVPLLSQTKLDLSKQDIEALTHKIQFGGDEVVKAKNGTGSATLSMAHAGAKMANSVLRALAGQSNIYEYSFVHTGGKIGGLEYFSTKVLLGKNGIEEVLDPGSMTAYEKSLYDQAVPELAKNISKGIGFA